MKRASWYTLIAVNIFWLGLNMRNTALGSIFMPFLVDMFVQPQIKNTALGFMRTAGLVIAMLVQPLSGLLSDRNTSRFGRRRPYIVAGVFFDLILLIAVGASANYWMLFIAVLLIQISSNISHGPLQGLIPDLIPAEQRGMASAIKAIFELLPIILVSFTIAPIVASGHTFLAILLTMAVLLITMILTILFVHETPLQTRPTTSLIAPIVGVILILLGILAGAEVGGIASLLTGGLIGAVTWFFLRSNTALVVGIWIGGGVAMVVAIVAGVWSGIHLSLEQQARHEKAFTWWVVNRLMFLAAATSIQGFAPYFLMSAFQVNREKAIEMTAQLMMVAGILTVISAILSGWLSDRFGHKRLVGVAGVIGAIGSLTLLGTAVIPNLGLMYVAGSLIGMGTGLFMTTNWALGTNLVSTENAGRYLGISNLAGAGAGMIGAGIGGPVADLLNLHQPGLGYIALFAIYALLFLLSTVSLIGVRKTEQDRMVLNVAVS